MAQLANLDQHLRRIRLTDDDEGIRRRFWADYEDYIAGLQDRNDAAIMAARTACAYFGCINTRNRLMPVA